MNTNRLSHLIALVATTASMFGASVATAAQPSNTTAISPDQYYEQHVVERVRSGAKASAVFSAEPSRIIAGADVIFELRSVTGSQSSMRWRCVARDDVAECLGTPLSMKYRPADDKMTLTVIVVPERTDVMVARAD